MAEWMSRPGRDDDLGGDADGTPRRRGLSQYQTSRCPAWNCHHQRCPWSFCQVVLPLEEEIVP
jgi:hypothetical protein